MNINEFAFLYLIRCNLFKFTILYRLRYKFDMKVSEFVKTKRKQAGLTQPEFASKSGVGLRFLRELEQGKTTLKMDKVNTVLWMFGFGLGPVKIDMLEEYEKG